MILNTGVLVYYVRGKNKCLPCLHIGRLRMSLEGRSAAIFADWRLSVSVREDINTNLLFKFRNVGDYHAGYQVMVHLSLKVFEVVFDILLFVFNKLSPQELNQRVFEELFPLSIRVFPENL